MFNRELAEFHLIKQQNFFNYLTKEDVSGSFLFVGQKCIGKKDFACLISESILKDSGKISKNIHPDFYLLESDAEQLVVDDIAKVEAWVFNQPFEAERKILVIPSADKMNPIAQNKLLKILEEPPDYLFFFLLTSNKALLLPTVESRCIETNFEILSDDIVAKSLEGRFKDEGIRNIALFLLNGSHDYEHFYSEEGIKDMLDFLTIVVDKKALLIDQAIDHMDQFFKIKKSQHRVVNTIVRLLGLLLINKHKGTDGYYDRLSSFKMVKASSYSIIHLVSSLENLNIELRGTPLNLRIGLEEIVLDFILDKNKFNIG